MDELTIKEMLRVLAGLDERLRADPRDVYSLLARGMLQSRLGDDLRAAEDFSRVIELDPDNADALCGRGTAKSALRDYEGPSATWTGPWPSGRKTRLPS